MIQELPGSCRRPKESCEKASKKEPEDEEEAEKAAGNGMVVP